MIEDHILYSYEVQIMKGAALLRDQALGLPLQRCAEMIISSKPFNDYEACTEAFTSLMAVLSATETAISSVNHVVVHKQNPSHVSPDAPIVEGEGWHKTVLFKSYVADAEALKGEQFVASVVGTVKINQSSVDAIKEIATPTLQ